MLSSSAFLPSQNQRRITQDILSDTIMAVLETLAGVEITISVNSEAAKEYQEEKPMANYDEFQNLNQRTITRFIEAIDNTEFAIKIVDQKPYQHTCPVLGFFAEVDGNHVATSLLTAAAWKEREKEDKAYSKIIKGPKCSVGNKTYIRPMKFTSNKTSRLQSYSSEMAMLTFLKPMKFPPQQGSQIRLHYTTMLVKSSFKFSSAHLSH